MILHKYETFFYHCAYLVFLIRGTLEIFFARDNIVSASRARFDDGWTWLGRPKDNTSLEITFINNFLLRNLHWYGIHLVICELCRVLKPQFRNIVHALVGLAYVMVSFHPVAVALILLELFSFYMASKLRSKLLSWIVAVAWTYGINAVKDSGELNQVLGYEKLYELMISLAWCILKCLSFSLSGVDDQRGDVFSLRNYLGYTLYLPTFVYGPFMLFGRYLAFTNEAPAGHSQFTRYALFLKRLGKILFWILAMQFTRHYIYVHYLTRDMDAVLRLGNTYGLYAFGYLMGQFFQVIYVITYGVGIAFASFDGLNPPDPPKCIGYINHYSDMWKYFDRGLYEFLFKHIYAELCSRDSSSVRKMVAACGTFFFVFIWHGFSLNVQIWSLLNLIFLTLEKVLQFTVNSTWYQKNIAQKLSPSNQQRLGALLGAQLYLPSAYSNFYFFGGKELGEHFFRMTYRSGLWVFAITSFYSYCIFQSCEWFNSFNTKNSQRKSEATNGSCTQLYNENKICSQKKMKR